MPKDLQLLTSKSRIQTQLTLAPTSMFFFALCLPDVSTNEEVRPFWVAAVTGLCVGLQRPVGTTVWLDMRVHRR